VVATMVSEESLLLVHNNHEFLDKVFSVLVLLFEQVSKLLKQANNVYFPSLVGFSHVESLNMEQFGKSLQFFKNLSNFCLECNLTARNIIQQLDALYSIDNGFDKTHLIQTWGCIQDIFQILITIDSIIKSNVAIGESWREYKSITGSLLCDVQSSEFEVLLLELDAVVFSSRCFATCCEQDFDGNGFSDPFLEEFVEIINIGIKDMTSEWATASREVLPFPTYACESKFVGLAALYVLYYKIAKIGKPSILQNLCKFQTSVPLLTLYDNVSWTLEAFFSENNLESTLSTKKNNVADFRKQYLKEFLESLPEKVPRYVRDVEIWVVRFQDDTKLHYSSYLLREGLCIASRIKRVILLCLNLCRKEPTVSLTKRMVVRYFAVCLELLKIIQNTCTRSSIAQKAPVLSSDEKSTILSILDAWESKMKNQHQNVIVAILSLHKLIATTQIFSPTKFFLLRCTFSIVESDSTSLCKTDELLQVEQALQTIGSLIGWDASIRDICDCKTVFWEASSFLPTILSDIFKSHQRTFRLKAIFQAYCDPIHFFQACMIPGNTVDTRLASYKEWMLETLHQCIIEPICTAIEDSLRLRQHAIHLEFIESKALPGEIMLVSEFLHLEPLNIFGRVLDIRQIVENYLEKQFYNMTVLALHDWKTYGEMRKIAKSNLHLELCDSELPLGSLESGVDVLQIMRNISVFVSLYNYNINQQVFVERKPDRGAKHLKTVSTVSIAISMTTHGLGIMSTCVNFTYQYLVKSFEVFSEFLFDENIKSYLSKEIRWFKKHGADVDHLYPFSRAFAYNKDIRKLGEPAPGMSYLGKFRHHISKIGNALGYVRMVRSAGMRFISDDVEFVPDLKMEYDVTGEDAYAVLYKVLNDCSRKFNEETDYLKVLVDVFQQVLRSSNDVSHLENFYMIIPSLCVNFVETSLHAKEQLGRSHKGKEAYFTDDGFAVGVAYLMAILNQTRDFGTLQWFKSLQMSFDKDINNFNSSKKQNSEDQRTKLIQYRQQYQLLQFSLCGSQIFFS